MILGPMRLKFQVALFLGALILIQPQRTEAQRSYVVRAGDTVLSIARRHRIGVAQLAASNRIRNNLIRPGQRLTIPRRGSSRGRVDRGIHTVRAGHTLAAIARRYGVSIASLRRANRISGNRILPGTELRIPGRGMGRQRPEGAEPAVRTEAQQEASELAQRLGLGNSRMAHRLLTNPPEPAWVEAAGEFEGDGTLLIPIESGVYLRGWGSGTNGYHLAIDIGARPGTPVLASARGLVLYVGASIRGYGNLVIIAHPNGLVSWYAHNRQNLVVAGQRVERGETIAHVGSTGYARGPHVHYMLTHGGLHCDALPLFRPAFANREAGSEEWTDERPEAVRCAPKRQLRRRRRRR